MKKIFLPVIAILLCFHSFAQIKIYSGVYLQCDNQHKAKLLKTIIFKSDAPGDYKEIFIDRCAKHGIKAISYYDLFPQVKEYSEIYVDSILTKLNCDAFVVILLSSEPYSGYLTFTGYNSGNFSIGTMTPSNGAKVSASFYFFNQKDSKNPYALVNADLLSKGGWGKRNLKLGDKAMHLSLLGLERNHLILNKYKYD
jgi:hypothetical protein